MFKRLLFIFCVSLNFYSCVERLDFTDVKVDGQYELRVPGYLQPCTDLHKNAAMQLQSTENDIYLVVIDEKKSVIHDLGMYYNLKSYYSSVLKQPFIKEIKNTITDSIPVPLQIGANKALITTIKGLVNNQRVFYKLAVIETPTSFYQIIIWTRNDKKGRFENDMMKIIKSFKEEKPSDKK